MRAPLFTALLLLTAASLPGCRGMLPGSTVQARDQGALVHKDLKSIHVVYSEYEGRAGYVKVFDVVEAGGQAFPWKYVYDNDWNELGFIDQLGTAYRYHRYPQAEEAIHKTPLRLERMPADSTEQNVMRMLGLDNAIDSVSFPEASREDILGG